MALIAVPNRTLSNDADRRTAELHTNSDTAGRFRFDGLARGDYTIRNVATSRYLGSVIKVRAGAGQADLVLVPRRDLWIHGTVMEGDQPLAGVRIGQAHDSLTTRYSATDGSFRFHLHDKGDEPGTNNLNFSLAGYHTKRILLRLDDPHASDLSLGHVRLDRIEGQARILGSVTGGDSPVANARVFLRSKERGDYYESLTDAGGYFELGGVALGIYQIAVIPKTGYQDYIDDELRVEQTDLELHFALEAREQATLRGQMVDLNGSPVPGFTLWLTSLSARANGGRPIVGDALGMFEVQDLPAGELHFATRSEPRLRISGAAVHGHDAPPLKLVLDVGDGILNGQVVDTYSNPVAAARVALNWTHKTGKITSHAIRNATTDTTGRFTFAGLGPGVHSFTVTAPGYQRQSFKRESGSAGRIELTTLPP